MATIKLPKGHKWEEVNVGAAAVGFECKCGASFIHDLIDGSQEYNAGDGDHN